MSAQWWESVSDLVSRQVRGRGDQKVWVEDAYSQSLIACLIGTIQEHLYPNKEVTRSILRTGIWESFLRSLRLELQFIKRSCQNKLKEKGIDAVMLHIEIDYVTLYANALALRALQEKLKRRREAKDLYYSSPSLLNLIEGPWILEALSAARSIVQLTVDTLAGKGYLRYCPARIFQRVVFAATFLFKALALGVVEHGQQTVLELLNSVIEALRSNACDEQHLPRGFAELLARLHEQRQSLSTQQYDDKEVSDEQPISASSNIPVEIQSSTTTNEFALPPIPNTASTQAASDLDLPLDNLFSNFMGSQPSAGFTNVSGNIPQTGQPLVPNTSTSYQNPEQISWEFAPQLFLPAVDRDQDVMLQSLWNMDTVDPTSLNLWDTLFGDTGNAQDPVNQQSQNSL
ncbi:uncharacterized protein L201_003851 [Kwoniella dendrophila CBS 6074]|uniref:Transcription factor domain-containing protein n=1 Tax=Kwoniella dendrophila CBS 6074 TaxID=1295534 RepID=A0AAX4JU23_9TREE